MNEFSEGYLPCPDTHPWEYESDVSPMCCPNKPIVNQWGGEDCTDSVYRDYDLGDGKN